jgi:hypothetical protein
MLALALRLNRKLSFLGRNRNVFTLANHRQLAFASANQCRLAQCQPIARKQSTKPRNSLVYSINGLSAFIEPVMLGIPSFSQLMKCGEYQRIPAIVMLRPIHISRVGSGRNMAIILAAATKPYNTTQSKGSGSFS